MSTGQAGIKMADVSITMEYNPSSIIDLERAHDLPLVTSSCTMRNFLMNLFLVLLILLGYLILYLFSKLI